MRNSFIIIVLTLLCSSCGGSSGPLSVESSIGSWSGRYTQAGGISCVDTFIGACAGCELGDIEVMVSREKFNYFIDIEHCFRESSECSICSYSGSQSEDLVLVAVSEETECAAEVKFELLEGSGAELFERSRPPRVNNCAVNFFSSLQRN